MTSLCFRQLKVANARPLLAQSRSFTRTAIARNGSVSVGAPPPAKRPIGGIRGGIVGFLFGFSLAASIGAYNLLDEYQRASATLQASIEELKLATAAVTEHVRRIETVEKDVKHLQQSSASKDELFKLRGEMKKVYDGLHVELLDLRSHMWGIQQDIQGLGKK